MQRRNKTAVRLCVLTVFLLLFFFFSNDFGLIDIQKTAIIVSVGIDREENEFVVTSQVAVPQASKQGEQVQPTQLTTKGKTIAEAIASINAKTGWYPKLVFCNLIVLGKSFAEKNVFEGLDFFLRDNYATDQCSLAVVDGSAKEIITAQTPIENISGLAIQKVLSPHAKREGVLATSLREFAIGYFSERKSGTIPILEEVKEVQVGQEESPNQSEGSSGGKKVLFSARKTALFYDGVWVDTLTEEESFAVSLVKEKIRLASFSIDADGSQFSLLIRKNEGKVDFHVDKNGCPTLRLFVTAIAVLQDTSTPSTIFELGETAIPSGVKRATEKKIENLLQQAFLKGKECGADLFDSISALKRNEKKYFTAYQKDLLNRLRFSVEVKVKNG